MVECTGMECMELTRTYFKIACSGPYKNLPIKMRISNRNINGKFDEICEEPSHNVRIAYNNEPPYFELGTDGKMVQHKKYKVKGTQSYISSEYDILASFFENYKIIPTWINCHFTWGTFDKETGHWTGAVGKVHTVNQTSLYKLSDWDASRNIAKL